MELQNNSDQHVNAQSQDTIEEVDLQAVPGKAYPIRLLHLTNGMIIIGYVISVIGDTIMVLRPHILDIEYNPASKNIEHYEFDPYMDQLADNDPLSVDPTPFVLSNVFSVNRPTQHVVENFAGIVRLKEVASIDPERIFLAERSYPSSKVLH